MFFKKDLFSDVFVKLLSIVKKNYDLQTITLVRHNSTFHHRTLDYFRNHPHYNTFLLKHLKPSMIETNKFVYNPIKLKIISTDELLMKLSSTNIKSSQLEIDRELANRVQNMTISQILVLMDTCLFEHNQLFKYSKSFKKCIEVMNELWFRRPDLTTNQTIQLIYYISTYKNKSKAVVEFGLQKLMNEINYLKQLTDEELSVLAVATYKSSAKVYDKLLRIFAFRVETNLENLIQNPLYFVSLIKPLKRAKYHDPILFAKIIGFLNNNNNNTNTILNDVISSIHLLTYFADANCGDVKFLQKLIDSIGNIMIKDELQNYRIKDVSNYLFSVSYLGLTPKDHNVCKMIMNFLDQIFDTKEKCKKRSNVLIGMCLSMWMLGYKPIKLMKFVFSEVSVATLKMPNKHKQNNRFNLLLTCCIIEQPDLVTQYQLVENTFSSMPEAYKHLGERPFLVEVFKTLQELSHNLNALNIEYNFNIPHLKILGIKVIKTNGKVIFVEVLDKTTCLYDTHIPNGMMKLKFRLEAKLNVSTITVNQREIILYKATSLKRYLESVLLS